MSPLQRSFRIFLLEKVKQFGCQIKEIISIHGLSEQDLQCTEEKQCEGKIE